MLEHLPEAAGLGCRQEDGQVQTHQSATILTIDPHFPNGESGLLSLQLF
jgi:hypothetical protein